MCLASKYFDQIEVMLKAIDGDIEKLCKKQAEYDRMINQYYHHLETTKFNACEGYYIAKNFQTELQKRRLVKGELSRLQTLKEALQSQAVNKSLHKAKSTVKKSKEKGRKWCKNFNFTFSDIEEEIMH
ncbi:hypothetical protein [Bacillus sp. UMB0728]|uniref:hypothetical protein n=1 Tax=Bacillus sp. UMB0728 TaxID=2066052 RepID=UPI000C790664|nr:hypothetical protein [Bacillus sp. UMB0728]PLR72162.1 hypothetical protein CYJ37_11440 [Bacillus sp. UMB0728]